MSSHILRYDVAFTQPASVATLPQRPDHSVRFGVMIMPDQPMATLRERFRQVEALGFDQMYVPDHMGDFRDLAGTWFEGGTLLAAAAMHTERIRVGMMVSNPILRSPALLAKQALAIDHLSGGRVDVGLGAGLFALDHHAVGEEPWSPRERAGRFADYVQIVDGVMRGDTPSFTFEGQWLWARDVPTAPGPVQRPRPPMIVGGQSPTVLRVAAAHADVWNTIGPMGANLEEVLDATARQNRQLDDLCAAAGRDPRSLRRSLTTFAATDPWESPISLIEVVERFRPAGIDEFVIGWPPEDRLGEFAWFANEILPSFSRES